MNRSIESDGGDSMYGRVMPEASTTADLISTTRTTEDGFQKSSEHDNSNNSEEVFAGIDAFGRFRRSENRLQRPELGRCAGERCGRARNDRRPRQDVPAGDRKS